MITASARSLLPLTLALFLSGPAFAQNKPAAAKPAARVALTKAFLIVESGKGFDQLQQAVDTIGEGRGTIRIASGTYHQCAVQRAGEISYVAAEAGAAIFDGKACDEKAALVLSGSSARIDGLIFQNIRRGPAPLPAAKVAQPPAETPAPDAVPDAETDLPPEADAAPAPPVSERTQPRETPPTSRTPFSALALERGSLSIVNALFRASDQALVTADLPEITISIRQASFTEMGNCAADVACGPALAIGKIAKLRIVANHFAGAALSAGAATMDALDNRFEDSAAHAPTAPLLALPHGAIGRVKENEFLLHHADRSVDAALIAVAKQDKHNPSRGLVIDDNIIRFGDGISGTALFVANYSGEVVAVGHNEYGAGITAYQRPANPAP
jgi:hypothetical protein